MPWNILKYGDCPSAYSPSSWRHTFMRRFFSIALTTLLGLSATLASTVDAHPGHFGYPYYRAGGGTYPYVSDYRRPGYRPLRRHRSFNRGYRQGFRRGVTVGRRGYRGRPVYRNGRRISLINNISRSVRDVVIIATRP